jgi:hypothetical protein
MFSIYNADNWQKFNDLNISLNGRHLYNYILTGRQRNLIGLCIFSIPVASVDTKLSTRAINKALGELSKHNLIEFDAKSCSLFASETLLDLLKRGQLQAEDNRVKAVYKIWGTVKGLTNQVITKFYDMYSDSLRLKAPSEAPSTSIQGSKDSGNKRLEDLDQENLNFQKQIQAAVSEIVDPYTTVYQLQQFGREHFKNDRTTEHQLALWLEQHGGVSLDLLRQAAKKTQEKIAEGDSIDGPMLYALACTVNGISRKRSAVKATKSDNPKLTAEQIRANAQARYDRTQKKIAESNAQTLARKDENDRLAKEMFKALRESKVA